MLIESNPVFFTVVECKKRTFVQNVAMCFPKNSRCTTSCLRSWTWRTSTTSPSTRTIWPITSTSASYNRWNSSILRVVVVAVTDVVALVFVDVVTDVVVLTDITDVVVVTDVVALLLLIMFEVVDAKFNLFIKHWTSYNSIELLSVSQRDLKVPTHFSYTSTQSWYIILLSL